MKLKKIQYKISSLNPNNIVNLLNLTDINKEVLRTAVFHISFVYSMGDYTGLPIYVDDVQGNELDYYTTVLSSIFLKYFNPYIYLLKHIENDLSIKGLKSSKTVTDNGSHNIDKNYNNTINTNDEDKIVTENAPITADIDTISTPNFKSKNINNKNSSKTGKDTDTHTTSNNMEETNPELFNKYMELYKEYNILDIVDKCYRRIIAEFNSSL